MSIKNYIEDGVTYFQVSVAVRSKNNRSIRVQKQKAGITTLLLAKKAEKELKEQALRETIEKEHAELSWGALVREWELALRSGDGIDKVVGKKPLSKTTRRSSTLTHPCGGNAPQTKSREVMSVLHTRK